MRSSLKGHIPTKGVVNDIFIVNGTFWSKENVFEKYTHIFLGKSFDSPNTLHFSVLSTKTYWQYIVYYEHSSNIRQAYVCRYEYPENMVKHHLILDPVYVDNHPDYKTSECKFKNS